MLEGGTLADKVSNSRLGMPLPASPSLSPSHLPGGDGSRFPPPEHAPRVLPKALTIILYISTTLGAWQLRGTSVGTF